MNKFAPFCVLLLSIHTVKAEDWPQWRGVNRDAVLDDTKLVESFSGERLPLQWSVPVGAGYSGPTVADGRVYLTDRGPEGATKEIERVLCFDAKDGSLIWEHSYEARYIKVGYKAGPRATVTIHDGLAIAVGTMGHMKCFDAVKGDVIWEHDLNTKYSIRMPAWGIAGAPLVYQDLVIQIVAGSDNACVVAFDVKTGEPRWQALNEAAGYSAPILIKQGDQDVVVCWTGESVSGLNPSTGDVFWSVPMSSRNMPIGVATPVVQGNDLFVSSFYDGSLLIRLDPKRPSAKQTWRRIGISEKNTDALHCMISTPVIKGDHIYGVDSYGELRCLDLKTGDRIWENKTVVPINRWATVHTFRYGDRELLFNDQGELILGKLQPDGFQEISRTVLLDRTRRQLNRRGGVTWAHPAIADGFIYARNDKELVRASLKPDG
ncbi:MAG: PQQ-binding-like beta-propeller repeat protein [Planctomycetota bacterium]